MKKVFIVGSAGTTGLRLKERLTRRPDIELIEIDENLRKDKAEILRLIKLSDFVFLCLPDDAAREIVSLAKGLDVRIIDTSTAHRTDDEWSYGFPELSAKHRSAIAAEKLVASPGCHAGGFIALVYPLIASGLISPDTALTCTSITGYSGGGKQMIAEYETADAAAGRSSPKLYGMGQTHKHLPEMVRVCGLKKPPVFLPVVGNFYSGMLVTVPIDASMLKSDVDANDLRNLYKTHYAGSKMIKVSDDSPAALYSDALQGRDDMEIFISGTDGRYLLCVRFDNLGKGASGAAIQCLNIMCGLPEETGLTIN